MKKTQFFWLVVIIILAAAIVLRLTSRGGRWLCQDGEWVRQGQARVSRPTSTCPRSFSEPVSRDSSEIIVSEPQPDQLVVSPLQVSGQARSSWFFEANIPIRLTDDAGLTIASIGGQAQGDWMTAGIVPFAAKLEFVTQATSGYLVIAKDNPSGLPQNDASLSIPVRFK